MNCYLPCVRFTIRTSETKHSRPTDIDRVVLSFIADRKKRTGSCSLRTLLEFFGPLHDTLLHGVLHKLHRHYLNLSPSGELDLHTGVAELLARGSLDGLVVEVGERTKRYGAFFELFTGSVFLDQLPPKYAPIPRDRIRREPLLPLLFKELDYEDRTIIPEDAYRSLVNEFLRNVAEAGEEEGDFYRVETVQTIPEVVDGHESSVVCFPLLLYRVGGTFQVNARGLPHDIVLRVSQRLMDRELKDRLSDVLGRAEHASAAPLLDENPDWTEALARVFAPPRPERANCSCRVDGTASPAGMLDRLLSPSGAAVIHSFLLRELMQQDHIGVCRVLGTHLSAGGRLIVLCDQTDAFDDLPFCIAQTGWANGERQQLGQPITTLAGGDELSSWEVFSYATMRRLMEQFRGHPKLRSIKKKFRQQRELRALSLYVRATPQASPTQRSASEQGVFPFAATPDSLLIPISPSDGNRPLQLLQLSSKSDAFRNSAITWVESFLHDYTTIDRELESYLRPWHEERKPLASEVTAENEGALCEFSLWPLTAIDSFGKALAKASNAPGLKIVAGGPDGPQTLLADLEKAGCVVERRTWDSVMFPIDVEWVYLRPRALLMRAGVYALLITNELSTNAELLSLEPRSSEALQP